MASDTPRTRAVVNMTFRADTHICADDLAAHVGITPARLARLVNLGLVDPPDPVTSEYPAAAAERLGRLLRLRRELHVNLAGAAIIIDLLERIERLDAELLRFRERATR